MEATKPNWEPPFVSAEATIEGICDRCGKETRVGIVYAGPQAETLVFLCRDCGKEMGVE